MLRSHILIHIPPFFSTLMGFFLDSSFFLLPHFTQIRDTSCLRERLRGMRSTFAHTFESIAPSNVVEERKHLYFPLKNEQRLGVIKPTQHTIDKSGSKPK